MVIHILSFISLDSGVEQDEAGQAQEGHQALKGYPPLLCHFTHLTPAYFYNPALTNAHIGLMESLVAPNNPFLCRIGSICTRE